MLCHQLSAEACGLQPFPRHVFLNWPSGQTVGHKVHVGFTRRCVYYYTYVSVWVCAFIRKQNFWWVWLRDLFWDLHLPFDLSQPEWAILKKPLHSHRSHISQVFFCLMPSKSHDYESFTFLIKVNNNRFWFQSFRWTTWRGWGSQRSDLVYLSLH